MNIPLLSDSTEPHISVKILRFSLDYLQAGVYIYILLCYVICSCYFCSTGTLFLVFSIIIVLCERFYDDNVTEDNEAV